MQFEHGISEVCQEKNERKPCAFRVCGKCSKFRRMTNVYYDDTPVCSSCRAQIIPSPLMHSECFVQCELCKASVAETDTQENCDITICNSCTTKIIFMLSNSEPVMMTALDRVNVPVCGGVMLKVSIVVEKTQVKYYFPIPCGVLSSSEVDIDNSIAVDHPLFRLLFDISSCKVVNAKLTHKLDNYVS